MKRVLWPAVLVYLASTAVAQQASFTASYAASDAVTGERTIYLLGIAVGRLEPGTPFSAAAVEQALVRGAETYATGAPLALGEFAYLLSNYFQIEPGMMGRLFPGPRYALRDLRRERIILLEADASSPVPGDVALRTIRRALAWGENR